MVRCEPLANLEPYEHVRGHKFPGGDSSGVTPVPIPNTEVKTTTPKILGWRRPGKIGTARIKLKNEQQIRK